MGFGRKQHVAAECSVCTVLYEHWFQFNQCYNINSWIQTKSCTGPLVGLLIDSVLVTGRRNIREWHFVLIFHFLHKHNMYILTYLQTNRQPSDTIVVMLVVVTVGDIEWSETKFPKVMDHKIQSSYLKKNLTFTNTIPCGFGTGKKSVGTSNKLFINTHFGALSNLLMSEENNEQ